jgi:hypothetical protein
MLSCLHRKTPNPNNKHSCLMAGIISLFVAVTDSPRNRIFASFYAEKVMRMMFIFQNNK